MCSTTTLAIGLEQALRTVTTDVFPADASLAVDGIVPAVVAAPTSAKGLAAALAVANEHGAAVIPWGAGQHMALGNVPARYDLALRTTNLTRVLEYEPADLTITVEAGITLGALEALLAEHGQFLPIDAPAAATVGGVLAAGVSGPSRHAYGLPRDWLIGCRVAHPDGSVSKGGGRVVKNVAGYDMPKLAVGSLGTLGIIAEATLKVAPLPSAQETLVIHCDSLDEAARLAFVADERSMSLRAISIVGLPAAAALRASHANALLMSWLAGPQSAVDRTSQELGELTRSKHTRLLAGQESHEWWAHLATAKLLPVPAAHARVSLPASSVVGFMERVQAAMIGYPTTGLVLAQFGQEQPADKINQARELARAAGGSLVVTSAPLDVKRRIDVWDDPGPALPLMRRLKEQFDPRGTLNPGRFIGGL